ncbi:MAG TPA: ATP-binding protein [Ohtaekwangia sp.]|nr:ATP-binding protein [Ohtaekwangia sp.]
MENDLKVLVLEDMEEDLELIEYSLKKAGMRCETKRVDTKEEFIAALNTYPADVILSDHALPQFNSAEALRICRSQGIQIPFILVTGAVSEEFAVNSLKQGADNYVLKSNLARLPSAIQSALKQREDEAAKLKAKEALLHQNEELTKINKELDSFVYSVSHNLKAPLMSVLGLLNLAKLEDEKLGNAFSSYLQMMERSIHKLDDTLQEILDYSKNARKELSVEMVDLAKMVRDNLEKMEFMPGAQLIKKTLHVETPAPFASDTYRISVILNNLISNAIKYADQSKDSFLNISISTDDEKAELVFEDNGIGIDPAYLNRVFDMFFRATMQKEGAGLGLYIVKETIDKLHGEVTVDSKPGKGTTFRIKIPNLFRQLQ